VLCSSTSGFSTHFCAPKLYTYPGSQASGVGVGQAATTQLMVTQLSPAVEAGRQVSALVSK